MFTKCYSIKNSKLLKYFHTRDKFRTRFASDKSALLETYSLFHISESFLRHNFQERFQGFINHRSDIKFKTLFETNQRQCRLGGIYNIDYKNESSASILYIGPIIAG